MGIASNNHDIGGSVLTNEYWVDLHRRILLPRSDWDEYSTLMAAKNYAEARELLKRRAPIDAREVIDVFFTDLK